MNRDKFRVEKSLIGWYCFYQDRPKRKAYIFKMSTGFRIQFGDTRTRGIPTFKEAEDVARNYLDRDEEVRG